MPEVLYRPNEIKEILLEVLPGILRQEISRLKDEKKSKRLNLKQAAAHLGMHPETLRRKFASGEYPLSLRHGTGRNKHYLSSELDDLMKKL